MRVLIDKFKEWTGVTGRVEEIIGAILALVLSALAVLWLFIGCDVTPATKEDYADLEEKLTAITFNESLNLGSIFQKTDTEISIVLENEECKIVANYYDNLQKRSIEKVDKSHSLILIIISAVCMFVILWFILFFVCTIIVYVIELLGLIIYYGIRSLIFKKL